MILVKENLWRNPGPRGMIVVTTNAIIKDDGSLVMGGGAAREATKRIFGIARECGNALEHSANVVTEGYLYGFLEIRPPKQDRVGFGIFQVKFNYREQASRILIEISTRQLADYVECTPGIGQVRMNFPGIGLGGMTKEEVLPLIECLPDNVVVCYK